MRFLSEIFCNCPAVYIADEFEDFACGDHTTFSLHAVGDRMAVEVNTLAMEVSNLKVQCLHFFVDDNACSDVIVYLSGNHRELWARVVGFMET